MIAISKRNDKYIAPSLLKIRNRKIPKIKTLKLSNSQIEKDQIYIKWLCYIHRCYHSFYKASPSKTLHNPSIFIHALWLIYFSKLFCLFTKFLAITKNKKGKKKTQQSSI